MLTLGVDIGSVTTKAVLLSANEILGSAILATKSRPRQAAEEAVAGALAAAARRPTEVAATVSTGYGRRVIDFGNRSITEITACARGFTLAAGAAPRPRTVIEVGGQDIKVIALDAQGAVADFVMNDKCAAGSGRFLEVIADALDIPLEDMGDWSLKARAALPINATCTVFAESEVISLLAQEARKEEIVAGVHAALAERIAAMARRFGPRAPIAFSGGVALNRGLVAAVEANLHTPIAVPPHPQLINALGCAIEARGLV